MEPNDTMAATLNLSKHEWAVLFLMLRNQISCHPTELWDLSDHLIDKVESALHDAIESKKAEDKEVKEQLNELLHKPVDFDCEFEEDK